MDTDEWQRRFSELLDRRAEIAGRGAFDEEQVTADVADSIAEVRHATVNPR